MPQLDPGSYTSQLFWLVLSFVSLYIFTWRISIPRVAKIIEERRKHIESFLSKADEIKTQSAQVRDEFEVVLDQARSKAHDSVLQMIHKVTVTATQRKKDLSTMMLERVQSSETHLNRRKVQALEEMKDVAQEAAILVVEKFIDKKFDAKELDKVLNEVFSQKVA